MLLLRTAADNDPEAANLYAEICQTRLDRMAENAQFLANCGVLRPGVTADEARDVLWSCTSPEFYDLMVLQRGWTTTRFGKLIADTIAGALL